MTTIETKADLVSVLKLLNGHRYILNSYKPIVTGITSLDQDGNFDKFGGIPSFYREDINEYHGLGENFDEEEYRECTDTAGYDPWPDCDHCKIKQTFFFQLTNPDTKISYQMFMCLQCENSYQATLFPIKYEECYSLDEILENSYEEKVVIDGNFTTWKFHFSQKFVEHIKAIREIAYDHLVPDQEYYRRSINTGRGISRHFRSYRVSSWEKREEAKVPIGTLLWAISSSPLGLKLPPWVCGHGDKCENYEITDFLDRNQRCKKYDDSDEDEEDDPANYKKNRQLIIEKLKGYGCWDFMHSSDKYGIKFGGQALSCQGNSYPNSIFHFNDTYYLPYMWGDAGMAHIIEGEYGSLKIEMDCS